MLYQEGERVLCHHVNLFYEAKVLKAEKWTGDDNETKSVGPHYLVHYHNWKSKWDEWVPETRIMKLNDENKKKAEEVKDQVMLVEATKKAEKSGGGSKAAQKDVKKAAEAGERARKSTEARGTKRGRDHVEEMEDWVERPEIKILIPEQLKSKLVDDWELITKDRLLVKLPRTPSVRDILDEFQRYYPTAARRNNETKLERRLPVFCDGLIEYFNLALGQNLLYTYERPQYRDVVEGSKSDSSEPAKVYGAEHLLRLFVNLPHYLAHSTIDEAQVADIKDYIGILFAFLVKEQKKFFTKDYETPSAPYQRSAESLK